MMIKTSTHENIYMDKIRIGYFWLLNIYCDYLLSLAYNTHSKIIYLFVYSYNAEQHLMLLNRKQKETRELLSDGIILNKQKFMHLIQ